MSDEVGFSLFGLCLCQWMPDRPALPGLKRGWPRWIRVTGRGVDLACLKQSEFDISSRFCFCLMMPGAGRGQPLQREGPFSPWFGPEPRVPWHVPDV